MYFTRMTYMYTHFNVLSSIVKWITASASVYIKNFASFCYLLAQERVRDLYCCEGIMSGMKHCLYVTGCLHYCHKFISCVAFSCHITSELCLSYIYLRGKVLRSCFEKNWASQNVRIYYRYSVRTSKSQYHIRIDL